MGDELIRNESQPRVVAQLVITMLEPVPGAAALNIQTTGDFNEMHARFMLSKTTALLDEHWRMANQPKVLPVNGAAVIPEAIRKYFRG